MTTLLRVILDKITPWHDDKVVNVRMDHAQNEVTRSNGITQRTERVIEQYVLADMVYKKRKNQQ
jgi:hypothetical protein